MQDFRSMMSGGGGGGGGGRIFGGERRLRPFPNQALKCPRCDSLNTKFCYYNNYNLSQPRHFCKSCRRYWTKGGVLRNVPVGGGCRKTKRSKPKTTSNGEIEKEKKSTASHSSSDSSSLTATTTTEAASSNPSAAAAAASALLNFPDSTTTTTLLSQNPNSNVMFEQSMIHVNGNNTTITEKNEMFPDTGGGGFTSLMNGSNPSPSPSFLGFNFSPFRLNHHDNQEQEEHILQQQQQQQQKMMVEDQLKFQELTKGLYGETTVVPVVDMHGLMNRTTTTTTSNGGLTGLDWQQHSSSNGIGGILHDHDHHHHQGLFDLPNSTSTVVVDHQSYWSHTSQWTENDHSLYLP